MRSMASIAPAGTRTAGADVGWGYLGGSVRTVIASIVAAIQPIVFSRSAVAMFRPSICKPC